MNKKLTAPYGGREGATSKFDKLELHNEWAEKGLLNPLLVERAWLPHKFQI